MWCWPLLYLLVFGGTEIRARPTEQYTDTLKRYYHDYHLMDDRELRAELTLVWFTIAGGAYYNLKEQVSADCNNASVAAATLWQELPSLEESTPLIADALSDAAADIRTMDRSSLLHPMEVVCRRLETRFRTNVTLHARFARLKQTVKIDPREGTPAIAHHQESANTSSLDHVNAFYVFWLQMPRIGQIVAHAAFANQLVASDHNCSAEYRLAKSIVELAKRGELRATVQNLYEKVRYDVIRSVIDKVVESEQEGHRVLVFQLVNDSIMVRLKKEFGEHPKLAVELEKMTEVEGKHCQSVDSSATSN
ncbi:hypothetical protein V9T40_009256 [Parthenolecanium corni]|uniref:Uncharacterized protein n=1 Tax=Parthenolecanium corni TaxID=536013 RepID=A0AAN9TME0_9HEMI